MASVGIETKGLRSRVRSTRLLGWTTLLGLAGIATLWVTRSRLVLLTFPPTRWNSILHSPPSLALRNPFRDAGVEEAANQFLMELKQSPGRLDTLPMPVPVRQRFIQNEREAPLVSWSLVQGRVNGGQAELRFVFTRWAPRMRGVEPSLYSLSGGLELQKTMDGWRVTEFGAAY